MSYLTPHPSHLSQIERSAIKTHRPAVVWLTGLSGSGKSTLANAVEYELWQRFRAHTYLLDGDTLRTGLNQDLGFDEAARTENIRRAGEVARLMVDAGLIVLTAFISPFRADRQSVRERLPAETFLEVYVRCPLAVCERRDPKGLYIRARAGLIPMFTGITSPYEEPLQPDVIVDTDQASVAAGAAAVLQALETRRIIFTSPTP